MILSRLIVVSGLVCVAGLISILPRAVAQDEAKTFTVTVDKAENGSITVEPAIPADGKVAAGTVLTVKATPAPGYAFDSGYYALPGQWGRSYFESPTPTFTVVVDRNKAVGASFIEAKALEGFTVIQDVVYAQPGVKKLKYDVFTPKGASNLPCIVIIHGGGWTVNTEDVMRGLARELVRGGKYVVMSMDYRWIGTADGDAVPNTMANIIEDVYGGLAHIQEHAREYGADPSRIAVTGDSAGGHLSAAAINLVEHIGDGGFGVKPGVYEFKPTYLPKGKTVTQVRQELTQAMKAAAPSYGIFSAKTLPRFGVGESEDARKAVSPEENIPNIAQHAVPQFLLLGTVDNLIRTADVQRYVDALRAAGQRAEFVRVEGASHAFLDWKPDAGVKQTFVKYGIPYSARMQEFFDSVFYPKQSQP